MKPRLSFKPAMVSSCRDAVAQASMLTPRAERVVDRSGQISAFRSRMLEGARFLDGA